MTRDSAAEHSSLVAARAPLIPAVMPFIAHPAIRNRGTVGGRAGARGPFRAVACGGSGPKRTLPCAQQS